MWRNIIFGDDESRFCLWQSGYTEDAMLLAAPIR